MDGYKFPVWSTKSCPRNETEWDDRSSFFNCNDESSYACLPNENFTELLEFCYPLQIISIEKGKYIYIYIEKEKNNKLYTEKTTLYISDTSLIFVV